jgi:hypothetical protein
MTKTLAKNTRHDSDRLKTSYYIDGNGRHVWMFQCGIMLRAKLWQQASRSKCRLLEDYDKALGMIGEECETEEVEVGVCSSCKHRYCKVYNPPCLGCMDDQRKPNWEAK